MEFKLLNKKTNICVVLQKLSLVGQRKIYFMHLDLFSMLPSFNTGINKSCNTGKHKTLL